jgi:hypothetical protein
MWKQLQKAIFEQFLHFGAKNVFFFLAKITDFWKLILGTWLYLYSIHLYCRIIVNYINYNIQSLFLLKIFSFLAFWGKKGKILTKISDFWKLFLNTSFYLYSIHFLWRFIVNNITMIFLISVLKIFCFLAFREKKVKF